MIIESHTYPDHTVIVWPVFIAGSNRKSIDLKNPDQRTSIFADTCITVSWNFGQLRNTMVLLVYLCGPGFICVAMILLAVEILLRSFSPMQFMFLQIM